MSAPTFVRPLSAEAASKADEPAQPSPLDPEAARQDTVYNQDIAAYGAVYCCHNFQSGRALMIAIRLARFPEDAKAMLSIWREHVASPSVSLDYQGYETEFADLPRNYAQPDGQVIIAERHGDAEGCIAFGKGDEHICEMKRFATCSRDCMSRNRPYFDVPRDLKWNQADIE